MRKQIKRIITVLLTAILLLPTAAQAVPKGWTDEVNAAYQTVTKLVIREVSDSRDYLSTATQSENAKAVCALYTTGAAVPQGFYEDWLQSLVDWLDSAEKRGKYPYIAGAIRAVTAMGLDAADIGGHNLLDVFQTPEMATEDEERLELLLDLTAANTDAYDELKETLIAEALARQQTNGSFHYDVASYALSSRHALDEGVEFDFILLTAKTVQALAPYRDRAAVNTAIDRALTYLSEKQLPSGGFRRFGAEDVREDAAVLEMMAALQIDLTDERFVKDGHTVLDGMLLWYQPHYFDGAKDAPKQGFYREAIHWSFWEPWGGWYESSSSLMADPDAPDDPNRAVKAREYCNRVAFAGLSALYGGKATAAVISTPEGTATGNGTIDYKGLLQAQSDDYVQKVAEGYYGDENTTMVSENSLSRFAQQVLGMEKAAGGELSKSQQAELQEMVKLLAGVNGEYLMGRKANTYSPSLVRAMVALDMDPADVNGMDFLAPLTNVDTKDGGELADGLMDFDAIEDYVWRKRGVDTDTVVDRYAAGMLEYQTVSGMFDPTAKYNLNSGHSEWRESTRVDRDYVAFTAENITALAAHTDKEYIRRAVESALAYLSSVQLADGSFPSQNGAANGEATLAVLEMMEALDISLDDERFTKNGHTVTDGLRTFYIDGVGFVSDAEIESSPADILADTSPVSYTLNAAETASALTYLQAAEKGRFGPDGKGNSVFEVVGTALTETPLGIVLLAVIAAALLALGMVRRYRRIKKEQ